MPPAGGTFDLQMLNAGIALTLSLAAVNAGHGFLIYKQRGKQNCTLSERAVSSNTNLAIYILAHLVAGSAFLLFSYQLFWLHYQNLLMVILASGGVLTQWLQAVIPDAGKLKTTHTALAFGMSGLMVALGIVGTFGLDISTSARALSLAIELIILSGYPLITIMPYKYFWLAQVVNINLFYLQMSVFLLAA